MFHGPIFTAGHPVSSGLQLDPGLVVAIVASVVIAGSLVLDVMTRASVRERLRTFVSERRSAQDVE